MHEASHRGLVPKVAIFAATFIFPVSYKNMKKYVHTCINMKYQNTHMYEHEISKPKLKLTEN